MLTSECWMQFITVIERMLRRILHLILRDRLVLLDRRAPLALGFHQAVHITQNGFEQVSKCHSPMF
jgi:hypothetical protein